MAASYPTSIKSFTTKVDGVTDILAEHINSPQEEIVAIQTELGVDPKWPTSICEGRLTLTSGTPVTTTDVTAATTLYFTPFKGNRVALYDGTRWRLHVFTERSLSLSGLTASRPYDIFVYNNAGTITLQAVAWTSGTARATALALQDGVYVQSGNTGRRYIGTICITATTGQCEDSETKRFVWNFYNQVEKNLYRTDSTSHTYASSTERPWNNDATQKLEFVFGQAALLSTSIAGLTSTTTGTSTRLAVGVDVTTGADRRYGVSGLGMANAAGLAGDGGFGMPAAGSHYMLPIESASATGTNTFTVYYMRGKLMC